MIEIQLHGFDELAVHLEGLAQRVRDELLAKATFEAAKAVETELLARTPINLEAYSSGSDALAPGEMLADIAVRPAESVEGSVAFFVGPGGKTAHVSKWVEYGHAMTRGKKSEAVSLTHKASGTTNVPAYPFIRPAQAASEKAALAAFEAVLAKEIH